MEGLDFGWLSVLPPLIAIALAFITKEVISSLLIGILSGAFIYSFGTGTGIIGGIETAFSQISSAAGDPDKFNIILFLGLLGLLIVVMTKAGGSRAYGSVVSKKLKTRRSTMLATSGLGALIFIDDSFNCLTVGTVMRPLTDKHRISRAKLAYIIDVTAAPICFIAPISSCATAVGVALMDTGNFESSSTFATFLQTIPFNFYCILSLIMVIFLSFTRLDFGPMYKAEKKAIETGELGALKNIDEVKEEDISSKGTIYDLIIPIVALIGLSILAMLYTGGYFDGGMSIGDAFGNCDSAFALVLSGFGANVVAFLMYVPRKLLSYKNFMGSVLDGVKSMVPAYVTLVFSWTVASVCTNLLGTGTFIGSLVGDSGAALTFIPVVAFCIASLLSFSTGTSWGTFGILIPIVAVVCSTADAQTLIVALAATVAGAVFGDHCSPVSDTTILSSAGAGVDHIEHVSTQIVYSLVVAVSSLIGYVVYGFSGSFWLSLPVAIAIMIVTIVLAGNYTKKKHGSIESLTEDIVIEVN